MHVYKYLKMTETQQNLKKLIEYTQKILNIQQINESLAHCQTYDEYHATLLKIMADDAETVAYIHQNFYGSTERQDDIILGPDKL